MTTPMMILVLSLTIMMVSAELIKITAQDALPHRTGTQVNLNSSTSVDTVANNSTKSVQLLLKILHALDKVDQGNASTYAPLNDTPPSSETRHLPSWFNIFKYDFNRHRKHSSMLQASPSGGLQEPRHYEQPNRKGALFRPIFSPIFQPEVVEKKPVSKPMYYNEPPTTSGIDDIIRAFESLPAYDDSFKPMKKPLPGGYGGPKRIREESRKLNPNKEQSLHKLKKYFEQPAMSESDEDKYNYSNEFTSGPKKHRKSGGNYLDHHSQRQPRCDKFTDDICIDDFEYPEHAILDEISKRKELFQLMFSEVKEDTSMVEGLPKDRDENFSLDYYYNNNEPDVDDYDEYSNTRRPSRPEMELSDTSGEMGGSMESGNGFVCRSEVIYAKPKLGKNLSNKWRVIVNAGDFTQPIRMEKCSRPNQECRFIADNKYESRCAQVYAVHRLLVFEKNKGFFIDAFRIPTACSCHVQQSRAESKQIFNQTKLPESELYSSQADDPMKTPKAPVERIRNNEIPAEVFLMSDETRKALNEEILRLLPRISPFLTEKVVRQLLDENGDMTMPDTNRKSLPAMFNDVKFALSAAATNAASSTSGHSSSSSTSGSSYTSGPSSSSSTSGHSLPNHSTSGHSRSGHSLSGHSTSGYSSSSSSTSGHSHSGHSSPGYSTSGNATLHFPSSSHTNSSWTPPTDVQQSLPVVNNHTTPVESHGSETGNGTVKINFSYHPILDYIVN